MTLRMFETLQTAVIERLSETDYVATLGGTRYNAVFDRSGTRPLDFKQLQLRHPNVS